MSPVPAPEGPLVFVGANELGRDALSVVEGLARAGQAVDFRGFVDDRAELQGGTVGGYPVFGGVGYLAERPGEMAALVTIGAPATRERVVERLAAAGVPFATLIHPSAVLGDSVTVGEGTLIMAGVTTTVDTELGRHVVVNPSCSLAHDVRVDDFAYLSPATHLSGRVEIGRRAYMGTGAVVIPGRRVGEDAVVGAGCVVIRDVKPGTTVVGVPGRSLQRDEEERG